jgi:N-glycosylase/DNA lyase
VPLTIAPPAGFSLETTARSHGWYDLAPFAWQEGVLSTVIVLDGRAHDLAIATGLQVRTRPAAPAARVRPIVRAILRLDEDLADFYALTDGDEALGWARARGAGRLLRAPTAFEDVIKMLLTTNCSWAFTRLMVERLSPLGLPAPSGRRAFPAPEALARKDERWFREVVKAGYRSPHLVAISRAVASGKLDLEALRDERDAEALREQLLELPGIGPYAADNLLRLLGGYAWLGLDSWCRGKLKRLYPRARNVDALAERRYRRYGRFQGLALWLDLTRDWHEGDQPLP